MGEIAAANRTDMVTMGRMLGFYSSKVQSYFTIGDGIRMTIEKMYGSTDLLYIRVEDYLLPSAHAGFIIRPWEIDTNTATPNEPVRTVGATKEALQALVATYLLLLP